MIIKENAICIIFLNSLKVDFFILSVVALLNQIPVKNKINKTTNKTLLKLQENYKWMVNISFFFLILVCLHSLKEGLM